MMAWNLKILCKKSLKATNYQKLINKLVIQFKNVETLIQKKDQISNKLCKTYKIDLFIYVILI